MNSGPVPRRTPALFLRRVALRLLALVGWRTSFVWPPEPRGVIIVYPHTSNWDFPLGMLFRIGHGLPRQLGRQDRDVPAAVRLAC